MQEKYNLLPNKVSYLVPQKDTSQAICKFQFDCWFGFFHSYFVCTLGKVGMCMLWASAEDIRLRWPYDVWNVHPATTLWPFSYFVGLLFVVFLAHGFSNMQVVEGFLWRPKYWKYSPNSRPCDKSAPSFLSPLLFLVHVFVIFPSYRDSFQRSARKHTKNSSETTVPWELENPCDFFFIMSNIFFPFKVFPKNKVKVMDNSLHYREKTKKTWETTCPSFLLGTLHSVA